MPNIPVDTGPQVAPAELQGGELNAQVTPGEAGGAVAEGVQRFGGALADVAIAMKQKVDTIQAINADTAFGTAVSTALYDPEIGVRAIKGQAAAGRYAQAQKDLTDQQNKIADGLQNQTQRAEFLRSSHGRMEVFQRLGGEHVAQQTEVAEQDAYAGQLKLAQANGVAAVSSHGADEPAILAHGAQETADAVRAFGVRHGATDAQIEEHTQLALGAYHTQVAETMLEAGLVPEANAWFDVHRDQMDANSRNNLGEKLKAANRQKVAQDRADAAWSAAKDAKEDKANVLRGVDAALDASHAVDASGQPGALSPSEDAARVASIQSGEDPPAVFRAGDDIDEVRAFAALASDDNLRKDPELMAQAESALSARIRQEQNQQRLADTQAAEPLMADVLTNRGIISPATAAKLEGLPVRIQNMVRNMANNVANPVNTDPQAWTRMQAVMADPRFKDATPFELQEAMSGGLDRKDQNEVWDRWRAAKKDKDQGTALTRDEAITLGMRAANIKTTTKIGAQNALDARDHLTKWAAQLFAANGKVPESSEYAKELGRWAASTGALRRPLTTEQVAGRVAESQAWTERERARLDPTYIPRQESPQETATAHGIDYRSLHPRVRERLEALQAEGARAFDARDIARMEILNAQIEDILKMHVPRAPSTRRPAQP